jgi:phage terminase small subunit
MARGRTPQNEAVVPMREEGQPSHNMEARAQAQAEALRPEGLEGPLLWTYRRLAPALCHPSVARLNASNIFMFVQLCRAITRHERLATELDELKETYKVVTRNGTQFKTRPEVAQLNETFRQIRGLAGEFGMTPATARGLTDGGQMPFDLGDPLDPHGYMT